MRWCDAVLSYICIMRSVYTDVSRLISVSRTFSSDSLLMLHVFCILYLHEASKGPSVSLRKSKYWSKVDEEDCYSLRRSRSNFLTCSLGQGEDC